jgi:hypothetical protein
MSSTPDEEEIPVEIWKCSEVFVYKVPPLTSTTAGYKAGDWGLDKPQITGGLKLLSKGVTLRVEIFDKGNKVASCPIKLDEDTNNPASSLEWWVISVTDSSRYFVVRAVDPNTKRQAMIGIGFRERNAAFEFQSALNDHFKRVIRSRQANNNKSEQSDDDNNGESSGNNNNNNNNEMNESGKYKLTGKITLKLSSVNKNSNNNEQQQPPSLSTLNINDNNKPPGTAATATTTTAGVVTAGDDEVEWGEFS